MLLKQLFENDDKATGRLSDEELFIAYDRLKQSEMSKEEIDEYAATMAEMGDFMRTAASAQFILNRMHILLHGKAPDGETQQRAETMFAIPRAMFDFVIRQGDLSEQDLHYHVEEAKKELANRPVTIKRDQAIEIMSQYYQQNKQMLPKDIAQHRDQIIDRLMSGMSPQQAFEV